MTPARRATPSGPDSAPAVELGAPDWAGPTKASVKAQSRRAAQAQQAGAIAAYRHAHPELNPQATDHTVWALIFIEQVGKSAAATAADTRETTNTRGAQA